jgi:hypothetical protein
MTSGMSATIGELRSAYQSSRKRLGACPYLGMGRRGIDANPLIKSSLGDTTTAGHDGLPPGISKEEDGRGWPWSEVER